jgi:hypothetical protein
VLAVLVSLVTGTSGCGNSYQLADVSGRVTMDGEPLADATVSFVHSEGPSSFGRTDADGRYTLETVADGERGALVGTHVVRVNVSHGGDAESDELVTPPEGALIPPRYNTESNLTFEVSSGGSDEANFELTSEASSEPTSE